MVDQNVPQQNTTVTDPIAPSVQTDPQSSMPLQGVVTEDVLMNPPQPGQPTDIPFEQQDDSGANANYIENVGGSFFDLLNDVLSKQELMADIAKEMNVTTLNCSKIAEGIQNKIKQNQLTKEEIAFILTATLVDLPPEEQS